VVELIEIEEKRVMGTVQYENIFLTPGNQIGEANLVPQ
jgi:hypothetical protein